METCEVEIEEEDGNNVADREYEGDDTMEEEDDDVFASQQARIIRQAEVIRISALKCPETRRPPLDM